MLYNHVYTYERWKKVSILPMCVTCTCTCTCKCIQVGIACLCICTCTQTVYMHILYMKNTEVIMLAEMITTAVQRDCYFG